MFGRVMFLSVVSLAMAPVAAPIRPSLRMFLFSSAKQTGIIRANINVRHNAMHIVLIISLLSATPLYYEKLQCGFAGIL